MARATARADGTALLVLSPHLDDAVLSCGGWLARAPGAVVVTVFAGKPAPSDALTHWDAACGFACGDDVVEHRREEDRRALALLGARPVWLEFLDAQYGASPAPSAIAAGIAATIAAERPQRVAFPLGLFHSDHVLVSAAALHVALDAGDVEWIAYEDALYRAIGDASAERRLQLEALGWGFEPIPTPWDAETTARKRAALECYPSQLRGLATPGRPDIRDALAAERYLRVTLRPASSAPVQPVLRTPAAVARPRTIAAGAGRP
jgi:LmbE family N-acetylglucosaminyl deacetylase